MQLKRQVEMLSSLVGEPLAQAAPTRRPSRQDAEDAVRTLIQWAGDDPTREGMLDTPKRVAKAYEELFAGYQQEPVAILQRTFDEVSGYDEMVLLRDIRLVSHCEHHMLPILGKAHVAYMPRNRVVGISKLARIVHMFARRFQVQEKLTAQIADTINQVLQPKGVAVVVEATHHCMTIRGVQTPGSLMVTSRILGLFKTDLTLRREFLDAIGNPSSTGAH